MIANRFPGPTDYLSGLLPSGDSARCAAISSPSALRKILADLPTIVAARNAMLCGEIGEREVAALLTELTRDFVAGVSFPHNLELCALAVALETVNSPFADEYLLSLGQADCPELGIVKQVVARCLRTRRLSASSDFITACADPNSTIDTAISFKTDADIEFHKEAA